MTTKIIQADGIIVHCEHTKIIPVTELKPIKRKCTPHELAYAAQYRRTHADKVCASKAKSREKHIEKCRATGAAYYVANREARKARQRAYNAADRSRSRRYSAENYKRNPEVVKRKAAEWAAANPLRKKENRIVWRQTPSGRAAITQSRFKRKIVLRGGSVADCTNLIAKWRGEIVRCYICGAFLHGRICHIDHIIPLSRGGMHKPGNIAPACPFCNMSKGAKSLDQFRKERKDHGNKNNTYQENQSSAV